MASLKSNFAFAPPPEIDAQELKLRLQERIFEQTVDEIVDIIAGSLNNNVTRQPYVMRPTQLNIDLYGMWSHRLFASVLQ